MRDILKRQPRPVEIIESKPVFRGHLKVDELHLRHGLFEGGMSRVMSREVVSRRDAVVVLPYDPVLDRIVLIEQFRAAALMNGDSAWMTELVAGLVEDGENAEDVARRELLEESGLEAAGPLLPIAGLYSTPGFCSERFFMFCAPVDSSRAGGIHGLPEEHEDIRVYACTVADAVAAWQSSGVSNSPLSIGLLWLALHRRKLQQKWEKPDILPTL